MRSCQTACDHAPCITWPLCAPYPARTRQLHALIGGQITGNKILVEKQPPRGVFVCDHAGLVTNKFSLGNDVSVEGQERRSLLGR